MTRQPPSCNAEFGPFCGYHQTTPGQPDRELAETGPGTPCGQYLRRYWQPICLTAELGAAPKLLRFLGEDLVLFRDLGGRIGLVHKKCPHRRASLEFGRCEASGIRCCYHGWLFDIDGTILEIPGEPAHSKIAERVMQTRRLGAYPTREHNGLIFAYAGPPQAQPPFPIYDTFELPDTVMTPYAMPFNCNWIQVLDAIVDPVHTAFLHRDQFSDGFGELGEIQFYERQGSRVLGTATRRVGDHVWVRVNELILPNFTQSGAAFAVDGTTEKWFGRSAFTRWVVPVDDAHCIAFAWANFGARADPPEWNTPEGRQRIEQGEVVHRSYQQKQRRPGDLEAVEGMGPISDHQKEHLLPADRGVALYRRRIRRLCRDLAGGKPPPQPTDLAAGVIPTHGSDSVLNAPPADDGDDRALLKRINDQVMAIIFQADGMAGAARDQFIVERLQQISNPN